MSTDNTPAEPLESKADAAPARPATDETVEVVVGRIAKAHGLRGDVVVDVRTDEPERRFTTGAVLDTPRSRLTVRSVQWHGNRLIADFEEVADRNAAEALRGAELSVRVEVSQRPDDPEEYYDHQLVGLQAVGSDGEYAGEVVEVLHLPTQDVLSMLSPSGEELLVPFLRELVAAVDLSRHRLILSSSGEVVAGVLPEGTATPGTESGSRR